MIRRMTDHPVDNSIQDKVTGLEENEEQEKPSSKCARAGYLGFSPAFITDVVRMESLKEMHDGEYEVMSISEHPEVEGHICTDFSSSRGWKTILEGFFELLCLDYSWIQRDYFYTNYGGKRWFFDPSVPNNKGFVQRFFEWNGKVIILPLDERGDVWHEFCMYQDKNNFEYQLLQHDSCPLVQATRRAEYTRQWAGVPNEFKCKTDRNQRRYLRYSSEAGVDNKEKHKEGEIEHKEENEKEEIEKEMSRLVASATHIAFVNRNGGRECLGKYVNHSKAEFRRMGRRYLNPTGITVLTRVPQSGAAAAAAALAVLATPPQVIGSVQWVQCDRCSKWRAIPDYVDMEVLPEQWECSMNEWDATHNTCEAEEVSEEAMRFSKLGTGQGQTEAQVTAQVPVHGLGLEVGASPSAVPVGAVAGAGPGAGEGKAVDVPARDPAGRKDEGGVGALAPVAVKEEEGKDKPDEEKEEEMDEGPWEDPLASLPRNFPPPVVDEARLNGGQAIRNSSPRPKRPSPAAGVGTGSAGSRLGSVKKKLKYQEGQGGAVAPPPIVEVTMQALPPAGTMVVESWVQCENKGCGKWHLVEEGVMKFVEDKQVTCRLLGLQCAKATPKMEEEEEMVTPDKSDKWAACAFDSSFMQCTACKRLSYRRDVMKGKACDCGN